MLENQIFKCLNKNFIYFPEYQQGFKINDKLFNVLSDKYIKENDKKNILLEITKVLSKTKAYEIDDLP